MKNNISGISWAAGFAALVLAVIAAMIIFNRWMDAQIAEIRPPQPSAQAALSDPVKPAANPYGSNVVIDPLNDPLAPMPKVRLPAPTAADAAQEKRQTPVPVGDVLVQ